MSSETHIKLYDERKGFLLDVGFLVDIELEELNTGDASQAIKEYAIKRGGLTVMVIYGYFNRDCNCFYIGFEDKEALEDWKKRNGIRPKS